MGLPRLAYGARGAQSHADATADLHADQHAHGDTDALPLHCLRAVRVPAVERYAAADADAHAITEPYADTHAGRDANAHSLPAVYRVRWGNTYANSYARLPPGARRRMPVKVECERCENGMVFKWFPTRHGWDTKAQACEECNGSGKVEAEDEGDERHQPHRDSGLPTFEQIQEWRRLKD